MIKSACIETIFTELPFEKRFFAAKESGFDYVEFWSWSDKDLPAIKKLSKNAGVKVASISGDKDYSLIDPLHRHRYKDFLRSSIDAAKILECDTLVIHSNALGENGIVVNRYPELSSTVKLCTMYDNLKEIAPLAKNAGVTLVLEALNTVTDHPGNFLQTTQMASEIIETLGSLNIKVLYDAYHMQINEGKISDTLTKYIKNIGYIHAADCPGRHEPGTGEMDYNFILRHLYALGYTGVVGFELFPKSSAEEAVRAIHGVWPE